MHTFRLWRIFTTHSRVKVDEIKFDSSLSTLDKLSTSLPDGVYTTLRTFDYNKVLPLESQFLRLEESARLLKKTILLKRGLLREALREIVNLCQENVLRIRISVDLTHQHGTIYISAEKLRTPAVEDYTMGVCTVTWEAERNNPRAKKTSFLREAENIRCQLPMNVNEVLLVNRKGEILEGLSSNFFAIKKGEVWTECRRVLSGIVRSIILEETTTAGVKVHLTTIKISEIENLEEAFLTSASRSILPINKIDDQIVGTITPGCITKQLITLYVQRIQKLLEQI